MADLPDTDSGPLRSVPPGLVVASEIAWRGLLVAAVGALVIWACLTLSFIVGPVIIALVICALLEPIRRRLLRWGARPSVAWLAAFLIGFTLVVIITALAVGEFSSNYDDLARQTSDGLEKLTDWLANGPLRLKAGGLTDASDKALAAIKDDPSQALTGTVSVLSTTGSLIAGGLLTFLSALFFMKDRSLMWSWLLRLFPASARPLVHDSGVAAWEVLVSYTKVTLTSAIVDSTVIGIAAAIAGLPVAFALAVLVFLFAFIPTVGAVLSGSVVVLVALVASGPSTALILAIVVVVVQQIDANVMYPMLASRHLSLHPLASLLLVAAGGVLAGLFGAFIAVPLTAMAIAIIRTCRPHDDSLSDLRSADRQLRLEGFDADL